MVEKGKYIKRFKDLYELKNKTILSNELALQYFENLIVLVETITGHTKIKKLKITKNGK